MFLSIHPVPCYKFVRLVLLITRLVIITMKRDDSVLRAWWKRLVHD